MPARLHEWPIKSTFWNEEKHGRISPHSRPSQPNLLSWMARTINGTPLAAVPLTHPEATFARRLVSHIDMFRAGFQNFLMWSEQKPQQCAAYEQSIQREKFWEMWRRTRKYQQKKTTIKRHVNVSIAHPECFKNQRNQINHRVLWYWQQTCFSHYVSGSNIKVHSWNLGTNSQSPWLQILNRRTHDLMQFRSWKYELMLQQSHSCGRRIKNLRKWDRKSVV